MRASIAALVLAAGVAHADATPPASKVRASGMRCARVFPHGEGRARYEPIVDHDRFLDEERAIEVISDELAQAGLHMAGEKIALTDVYERHEIHMYRKINQPHDTVWRPGPTTVDGYDSQRKIGFLYLGAGRYNRMRLLFSQLPGNDDWFQYELRQFADAVAVAARGEKAVRELGLFYDPIAPSPVPCDGQGCEQVAAEKALRAQVRDFVACLKLDRK